MKRKMRENIKEEESQSKKLVRKCSTNSSSREQVGTRLGEIDDDDDDVEAHNPDIPVPPPPFPSLLPSLHFSPFSLPQFCIFSFPNSSLSFSKILMDATLGLLGSPGGGGGGGGGGVPSGGSATGSISTVSKEDNLGLSSEVSSSYPDESGLELGLGLSIGGGLKPKGGSWGQYARILTAKDFPSSGTKRNASDPVSPPNGTRSSQVVGWPPVRTYRMNSLVNQAKSPADGFSSMVDENKSKNVVIDSTNNGSKNNNNTTERVGSKTSLFVKVNMDGTVIGRKVDLNAHSCYEILAQTLENMFDGPTTTISSRRTGPSKLLDGSSEFVLTYEDKDGDWMLIGDVPWRMFRTSVKRLRIMRTSEPNGLAPGLQEKSGRQRTKAA